jgi:hypothetical protein
MSVTKSGVASRYGIQRSLTLVAVAAIEMALQKLEVVERRKAEKAGAE